MRDDMLDRLAPETNQRLRMELIEEALCPPEPQLLDTCVLQNLDWIHRQVQLSDSFIWDDKMTAKLERRYGSDLAEDLLALNVMYRRHEYYSGYPWLVCKTALEEAELLHGAKGESLRQLIEFLAGHQEDWDNNTYPGIAQGLLLSRRINRVSPLILRALGVKSADDVHQPDGPLSFLPDRGDRLVAAQALLSNIPVVLTTDRRTFWAHRLRLADFGL